MTIKHWLVQPANEPHQRAACHQPTADGTGTNSQDQVTCPDCLAAVIRGHCNAVAGEPGPLPARCARPPHKGGDHDWVPGSDALRHADFARQALDRIVRNPQSADAYAASALYEAVIHREAEEARHADVHGEEPVGVGTPSGMLPVRTPGAALGDAEDESEPGMRLESGRPAESILARRVIERWPA